MLVSPSGMPMTSMDDMAVNMAFTQPKNCGHYVPQNLVPNHYSLPNYTPFQPVCVPEVPTSYIWNNLQSQQQYILPSSQMSFSRTDIFDMKCPNLDYDATASPASSSFTSGATFAPPSPSQDAKPALQSDQGMPMYSFSQGSPPHFSPSMDDGRHYTETMSPTWAVPTFDADVWQCAPYPTYQMPAGHFHPAATVPQAQFSPLLAFDSSFHRPSVATNASPSLSGYVGDGLVAPGQLSLVPSMAVTTPDPHADPVQTTRPPGSTRTDRDDYIQDARRRGLSYKEIKRRGGFTEAESTLRGRHRILSKPKEMRVRKPQWCSRDVMLLCKAVEFFVDPSSQGSSVGAPTRTRNIRQGRASPKLPWKKISEWIHEHGATYPFAGAACAKKWEEIRNTAL